MGFSRQEYQSGLPCSPPGDLPDSGIEPASLISTALAGGFFTSATWEARVCVLGNLLMFHNIVLSLIILSIIFQILCQGI